VTGDSILAARSRTEEAAIVGIDLETDLAVIKVDGRNLATCRSATPTICACQLVLLARESG